MIYAFIRIWALIFLRIYFRKTIVYGENKVPDKGPLIVASNHPSAFLEASILTTVMHRPIHFMVRGDMFNPRFKFLFKWTKQIPIYRKKDGIANLRKNASSFDYTYKILGEGQAVLIFPEAKTVLEKKMRPIQRGTAHLAFGALPFIGPDNQLYIQPVAVNFTEPRVPGTDVVVKFGEPFVAQQATREDRDAIESFTEQLSHSLDDLIIQLEEPVEKIYDVFASIYLRMVYENNPGADAHAGLKKIAAFTNQASADNPSLKKAGDIMDALKRKKSETAIYFPDLVVLNKVGLTMMLILKSIWLLAGGWLWRVVRNIIFKKISTPTFQAPTSVGVFMVVMPLVTLILWIVFLLTHVPGYFVLLWILVMWLGSLIRAPWSMVKSLLFLSSKEKSALKSNVMGIIAELKSVWS